MIDETDRKHLRRCVDLAKTALENGDEPFGSILVSSDGEVLAEEMNQVSGGDATQHPEFALARWAGENMTPEEKSKATVYTSGEHCPMCAAAHGMAGLGRIVYASSSEQLAEWFNDMGMTETPRVIGRPIQDVIRDTTVDGPISNLAEEVHQLQRECHDVPGT